ncbi:MAG TPA: apolipoprotein N-acyltransferase [Myxococcaceae bacterium]|nr:apolipoprotein N-acyltransferase [Myxococcaceae bacterium]
MKRRWARRLAALAASTALCALYATVRAPWQWLGWFALVPWLLELDAAEDTRTTLTDAWLFSVAFATAALWWLPGAVHDYTSAPLAACWALLLLFAPLLEPQFLVFAAARRFAGRAAGVLAFLAAEWLLPRLVPDTLGFGLYPSGDIRQVADLGGVPLLTLLVLSTNEAIAFALRARARERRLRAAALTAGACAAAVLLPALYGHLRRAQLAAASTSGPTLVAGLVQTNLTHYGVLAEREGTYAATVHILEAHRALSQRLATSAPLDLLVWPETAYPTTFGAPQSPEGAELDAVIESLATDLSVPLFFGTYDRDDGHEYNAAVLLAPGGARLGTYRKARLFPLTERVPPLLEPARRFLPWMGTWTEGPGAAVLHVPLRAGGSAAVAPLICYDALDASLAAAGRRLGAQAFLTLSNDAWFSGTPAARLHLIAAAFRSIETRLPQGRATPSGLTASISSAGDLLLEADPDRPGGVIAELALSPPDAPLPLAARWGPWLGPVSLLGAVAAVAARRLRRR